MNQFTKERIIGLTGFAIWIFLIFVCSYYEKNIFTIIFSMCYAIWFGSFVNDLGRKANQEIQLHYDIEEEQNDYEEIL